MPMKPNLELSTGRRIGPGERVYVIAELGSNHDGSLEKAMRLVKAAKQAGADAVKFQSFQVETLINRRNKQNGQWEMHQAWDILEKLTLPREWHTELQTLCREIGIDFLSAPFDEDRLQLLAELDIPLIKIASGDLTHHAFLRQVAQLHKPVILSTGMAYLGEVETALKVLRDAGCEQVALLHCVSLYPPQFGDANIRAMVTMQNAFQVPVGYSDHTPGRTIPLGAVALGASIIEKHLTDDKTLPGPDHPYALDIDEFTEMVAEIRNLEAALGSGLKQPAPGEIPERIGARRAVYASRDIPAVILLQPEMLKVVRHAYEEGIDAPYATRLPGMRVAIAIPADTLLTWEMLAP